MSEQLPPQAPVDSEDDDHELLLIKAFAKRVGLTPKAIHKRIRLGQMPPGTIKQRLGRYVVDYTVFKRSIKPLN